MGIERETPKLKIDLLLGSMLLVNVAVNEALIMFDAAISCHVKNQVTNTPPSSPVDGDTYRLGSAPTGAWSGKRGQIAIYYNGWLFILPWPGFTFYDEAQNTKMFVFTVSPTGSTDGTVKSWTIA